MRGDEPDALAYNDWDVYEFPACAGMNRMSKRASKTYVGVPRMRGDEPTCGTQRTAGCTSSPHARG